MAKNPIGGILRRFAKWLVRKGLEELQGELDRQREAGAGTFNPLDDARDSTRR